ncbi:MAG: protoporphyrinogen oxidase [Deltaproteobacteria bacterium]|nr:protoporphyrinogen oxidase [Deltaproteobacteria bacterium]
MSAVAPSAATRVDALVIGAGIAGLAAAATLRRAGLDVRVLPNTLRVPGPARAAFSDLELESQLVPAAPANRLRGVFHDGRIVPFPLGPGSAARTPLVSAKGKLRILSEPFVRRGDPTDETVAEFIGRRLGAEAVERLVGPFLTGVYGGDERRLGAEAVFPSLVEAERRSGSIVRGMFAARNSAGAAALPGIHSCAGGLGDLPARLAADLGEAVALGTEVSSIARDGAGLRVETSRGNEALWSDRVVLAVPAYVAAGLVRALDAEASTALAGIEYAPLAVCHLGIDPTRASEPVEGFGFLVPRAAGLGLLGCLFLSNLFPGRAPEGRALLTCMIGGVRWPEVVDVPDDVLRERLYADLDVTLGPSDPPEILRTLRWARAVPQPGPDHPRRVAGVEARLADRGLSVAGSWVRGVSVADTLASGVAAARGLLQA